MHICSKTHWPAQEPEILCPLVPHPANGDEDQMVMTMTMNVMLMIMNISTCKRDMEAPVTE